MAGTPLCEMQVIGGETVVTALNVFSNGALISRTTYTYDANGTRTGSTTTLYQYDALGNVAHRLAGDGSLLTTHAYDAYGRFVAAYDPDGEAIDPATITDPFGYKGNVGYYTDHETGLILCTHRYYDPEVGRWISRDPIGYEGGLNLYEYCGGDPVNGVDPSGLLIQELLEAHGLSHGRKSAEIAIIDSMIDTGISIWNAYVSTCDYWYGTQEDPYQFNLGTAWNCAIDLQAQFYEQLDLVSAATACVRGENDGWLVTERFLNILGLATVVNGGGFRGKIALPSCGRVAASLEGMAARFSGRAGSVARGVARWLSKVWAKITGICFVAGTQVQVVTEPSLIESVTVAATDTPSKTMDTAARAQADRKQLSVVAAKEGDLNARYRRVVETTRMGDLITLTVRDNTTGTLFLLTQPAGTTVIARKDTDGNIEVLTRLASVPEHIDLEKYAFQTVSIETIKPGQYVVTRDPSTGKTELKPVVRTFIRTAYEIVHIDLTDRTGKTVESFCGTPEHPFFTPNGMVEMGKLKPGMEVSTRNTDELLIVKAVKREQHPKGIPVYNFEVADDHTYFVGQADGGTLVHNQCRGLWQVTREGTERVMRHNKFGKIYKSKSDGLWWSRDTAGHGQSKWKVFEETSDGLRWRADADEFGDFITGKHKGPTGMFIPWRELAGSGF